jgi:hypothetical protein
LLDDAGDLEQCRNAGPVVVDAGTEGDRVEMSSDE